MHGGARRPEGQYLEGGDTMRPRSEDFLPLYRPTLWCAVCESPDAKATTQWLNGLPAGVVACDECRAAVKRRQVGVTIEPDGSLSVTDGRLECAA